MNDILLLLPEIVLLIFAFVIFILDLLWKKQPEKAGMFPVLALLGSLGAFAATIYLWVSGGVHLDIIATDYSNKIPMLAVDQFALFFKAYVALTLAFVSVIASDYVRARTPFKGEFYAMTLMAGLALMLVASSVNLVMIFLAFEFLSITSYLLTGYLRDDELS
ncbi:MAG TPA: hypothetical protein ENK24_06250, partial [Anaerolineae bacterium]|nr:hypothetical protein [Anaerolineae bacterium]